MWAILSDIHANLEALTAVLADIDRHAVERIICLGDTVVYGPDPVACLDLVRRRCDVVLSGNFDAWVLSAEEGAGCPVVLASIERTRRDLVASPDGISLHRFLAGLQPSHREGARLFVHGSPRNTVHEYVYPEDIYSPRKMNRIFDLMDWVCFQGHTHLPGVFAHPLFRWDVKAGSPRRLAGDFDCQYFSPEECGGVWRLDDRKTLINPGSVGQPRDGDWRASYALVDGTAVRFRRVEYDVDTTVRKIHGNPDLEDFLGDRLREGR